MANMDKPKCPGNVQKYVQNNESHGKKAARHKIPYMASPKKVPRQKCLPRTRNFDYGVIVACEFFSAEISGQAQESAIFVLLC